MHEIAIVFKVIVGLVALFIMIGASFYLAWSMWAMITTGWVPYVPSYDEDIKLMKEKLILEKWKNMIDLGCWDGKALRFFVDNFWIVKWVWYDLNTPSIVFGKLINKIWKINNIELYKGDFLKVDISKFDYIYVYLLSECLEKIEDFVFSNMKDDAIIISNTFKFKKNTPFLVHQNKNWKDRVILYKKNK